jgi:flagellar basal body P-ring formation protein FlgA
MRAVIALVLAAVPAAVSATAAEGLSVSIRDNTVLPATTATISAVADLAGDPALVAAAGGRVLVDVPAQGSLRIEPALIRVALGPDLGRTATVAGTGLLRRAQRAVPAADLLAAVHAAAAAGGGSTVVTALRPVADLVVPDDGEPPEIHAVPLDRRPDGAIAYRVVVRRGDAELARTLIHAAVQRTITVLVADRDLARGAVLTAGDVRSSEMPAGRAGPGPATDAVWAIGRRLDRALDAGAAIQAAALHPVAAVSGGDAVVVIWEGGRVRLTGSGTALASAGIGERITVRRSDGATVHAVVTAPGVVQIGG